MAENNWRTPIRANKFCHAPTSFWVNNKVLLQRGWDCFIETVATQLMRGLHFSHKTFFNLSKHTGGNLATFILLFLCAPIFEAHNFLFQFVYFRRQRRLLLLSGESDSVGLHQLGIHLRDCGDNLVVIGKAIRRLQKGE